MYQSQDYVDVNSNPNYLSESSYKLPNIKRQAYTIIYLFLLIFISVSILFYVSQVLNINQQSSKLMHLEEKLETIKAKNEKLEVELASKTSLAEVEKIAKNKLNMVESDNKKTLVYNNNFNRKEKYLADLPKEKFFLAQIYDKLVNEVITVQAESLE